MLLSKYTRYQGYKDQSKHFRAPQVKLQHQIKCHQLQTGMLIQYAGSSNARLGGGSAGPFILIRQSRQASCVARAVGGGVQAISQPVWWLKSQESSAFDIEQDFLRELRLPTTVCPAAACGDIQQPA